MHDPGHRMGSVETEIAHEVDCVRMVWSWCRLVCPRSRSVREDCPSTSPPWVGCAYIYLFESCGSQGRLVVGLFPNLSDRHQGGIRYFSTRRLFALKKEACFRSSSGLFFLRHLIRRVEFCRQDRPWGQCSLPYLVLLVNNLRRFSSSSCNSMIAVIPHGVAVLASHPRGFFSLG